MSSNDEKNITQTSKNIDGEDLISGLCDDILCQILNFLPTKDAVRTSVLAQHWKNKWRLISSIDLHDDDSTDFDTMKRFERGHSFVVLMNRVLKQISSSTICRFVLHLQNWMYNPQDLVALFNDVLKREVQELNIHYYDGDISAFPISIFNCKSLTKLVLDMDCCTIRVQSYVCLPNLRSLYLCGIVLLVEDDLFPHSKELVLSFPVLESLECARCVWLNVKNMSINAPMLDTFTMRRPSFDFDEKVESFSIKINAPHLRVFSHEIFSNEDITFSNGSSIQKAFLDVGDEELYEISVKTGKLLKAVNRVEYLELGFDHFQDLANSGLLTHVNDYLTTLPPFGRLLQLQLYLPRCLASQELLLNLICKSPFLQTLRINYSRTEFHNHPLLVEEVPHCFLHTLEEVVFTIPEADAIIINLAKYVLQHSRVLKLMTISLRKEPSVIDSVNQVLLSSPRASSSVTIRVI